MDMTVEIDGSILEGGGQILRSAIAFSAVLQKPVVVRNIRAKRRNPGLRPQHLHGILALQKITDAEVKGTHVGSTEIVFKPSTRRGGEIIVDIGTAGSVTLILQALMLVAPFCVHPVIAHISGGTNVAWSPPIDYIQHVLLPRLKQMGYSGSLHLAKRGYYPRGGGKVSANLHPIRRLESINLPKSEKKPQIAGVSHCGSLPKHVAERQAQAATSELQQAGYHNVRIKSEHNPKTACPGSGISLWTVRDPTRLIGSDALGQRGVKAEVVGQQAAQSFLNELKTGAPVDRYQADMLVPYVALADGKSSFFVSELTQHTVTNIHVVEQFLEVKFHIEGDLGSPAWITVNGAALEGPAASSEHG